MRSDVLSKRLFTAGCFGLPWLWAVHVLYHWKGGTEDNDEGFINPDDREFFYDGVFFGRDCLILAQRSTPLGLLMLSSHYCFSISIRTQISPMMQW